MRIVTVRNFISLKAKLVNVNVVDASLYFGRSNLRAYTQCGTYRHSNLKLLSHLKKEKGLFLSRGKQH